MTDLADETRSLVFERQMPHPPEKVWRALTQSWLIEEWLMKNDFVAEVGHRFTFEAKPLPGWSGVVNCEVVAVEPPTRLAYRWGDGSEFGRRPRDGRNLDADPGGRWDPGADGAVRLPAAARDGP